MKVEAKHAADRTADLNDVDRTATGTKIKRELGGQGTNAQSQTASPTGLPMLTQPINPVRPLDDERNKKRKALQDEFKAIELEQKKMRIAKELAELDSED